MADGALTLEEARTGDSSTKQGIGTIAAVSLSLAGLGPFFTMAFATGFAAKGAGAAVPLSYILGAVGAFALAYVVVRFARRYADAGGVAYTYVGASLGKGVGFVAGWVYVVAWLCGTASVLTVASVAASTLFGRFGISIDWLWFFLALVVIVVTLNFLGVRVSLGLLVVLELGSMVFLLVIALIVIAVGGADGNSIRPLVDPSLSPTGWSGIFFGMIYGFAGFAGFEAAAALGREVREPGKTIPRAIMISLIGAAVFYVVVTYALTIGYGINNSEAWANDPAPLDTIVAQYVGPFWAQVVDILVVVSAFGSALGLVTLTSRSLAEISLHGQAPKILSRQHRRFGTPYAGVLLAGVVALVIGIGVGVPAGSSNLIGFVSGATVLAFLLVYVLMAIGSIRQRFLRDRELVKSGRFDRVAGVVIPGIAIVLLCFALYSSVVPQPPFPYNLQPAALAVVIIVSLIAYRALRARGAAVEFAAPPTDEKERPSA